METILIGLLVLILVGVSALVWLVLRGRGGGEKGEERLQAAASELFEKKFKDVVDFAAGSFKEREERVDSLFKEMRDALQQHKQYTESVEKNRVETHAELKQNLGTNFVLMERLQTSTERLRNVLSSSQSRGQFGQKIAEDILKAGGLIEGVHYYKEKSQETLATRPDFIFTLPDGYKINMDVKFPLANYARMIRVDGWADDSSEEAKKYKKDFEKDVKEKIKQISGRQYINPAENTLDFALMFIPNENIFAFIIEEFGALFEFALEQRVQLTSPYGLIGVVSMIQRASQNFYQRENIRDTLILLGEFADRYQKFKGRFESIGTNLQKSFNDYEDVKDKSFKRLELTMGKIERNQREGRVLKSEKESSLTLDEPIREE